MTPNQLAQYIDHTALTAEKMNKIFRHSVMKRLNTDFILYVSILVIFHSLKKNLLAQM